MKALEKDRTRRYETATGVRPRHRALPGGRPGRGGSAVGDIQVAQARASIVPILVTAGAFVALLLLAAAISSYLAIRASRAESEARGRLWQPSVPARRKQGIGNWRKAAQPGDCRRTGSARVEEAKAKKSEAEAKTVLEFFQDKVLAAARPKDQEGGLGVRRHDSRCGGRGRVGDRKNVCQPAGRGGVNPRHAGTELRVSERTRGGHPAAPTSRRATPASRRPGPPSSR